MTIATIPNKKLLEEVTRRIVASVRPRRVLLFGSAARRRMNENSDFDMLVVMRARASPPDSAENLSQPAWKRYCSGYCCSDRE